MTDLRLTLRDAALTYLERGWSVFPLQERDKVPWKMFPVGRHQRERRATEHEVMAWWRLGAPNVAIATGAISGLFVWDCDSELAYAASLRLGLPDTMTVKTGKGYHVYFALPDFPVGNRAGICTSVDVRGDGGYVVAAPSIHPSGAVYHCSDWYYPLAPAPDWIIRLIRRPAPVPYTPTTIRSNGYGAAALRHEAELVAYTLVNRNDRLYMAALKLGNLIAGGLLQRSEVEAVLLSAAAANGLIADDGEGQQRRTIASGINKGMESPRGHQ